MLCKKHIAQGGARERTAPRKGNASCEKYTALGAKKKSTLLENRGAKGRAKLATRKLQTLEEA